MSENKEKQQGRIIPREEFKLVKFKMNKEGVTITHHLSAPEPMDVTSVCESQPHPDLIESLSKLKIYMASRLGILEGWDFARDHLKKNPNALTKAKAGHDHAVDRMNVGGFMYQGSGETLGVAITGSIGLPVKGSSGITVGKITFNEDRLGYESEVMEICEEITDEVYNYLILRKKSQTNIEDQADGFDNNGRSQTTILDD